MHCKYWRQVEHARGVLGLQETVIHPEVFVLLLEVLTFSVRLHCHYCNLGLQVLKVCREILDSLVTTWSKVARFIS